MLDPHFLPATVLPATRSDVFGPLQGGERGLWQGRCAVAEYAFDEAGSLPRWALPESTEVLVTDQRIVYAYTRSESAAGLEVTSGELRWLWPQHLRVQPGARAAGHAAAQIQLVCSASDGSFPALVFAGGELSTVGDVDKLANLMRHSIARFRVDNAGPLGLSTPEVRMLSRLLIGPEFSNFQGGEGQTVTLLGALPVHRPAPQPAEAQYAEPQHVEAQYLEAQYLEPEYAEPEYAELEYAEPVYAGQQYAEPEYAGAPAPEPGPTPASGPESDSLLLATLHADLPQPHDLAYPATAADPQPYAADAQPYGGPEQAAWAEEPYPVSVGGTTVRLSGYRPGLAADEARALQAAAAEQDTQLTQPDLASRAASLAARVADLVAAAEAEEAQWAEQAQLAEAPAADSSDDPTTDLTARAERVRRTAARFAANSAQSKAGARRSENDPGSTIRGNQTF